MAILECNLHTTRNKISCMDFKLVDELSTAGRSMIGGRLLDRALQCTTHFSFFANIIPNILMKQNIL